MRQKKNLFFFLFVSVFILIGQETNLQDAEEKIRTLAKQILNSESDSLKEIANNELTDYLLEIVQYKKAYKYPFNSIEHISVLQPKKKEFKLFTWFIPYLNGTFEYHGIIQICNKRGKKCKTYQIQKNLKLSQQDLYNELSFNNWYGCLYYDIIPIKIKKDIYYTLLGWDASSSKTTKKIIDILKVDKNKIPSFGAKIFNNNKYRFLIEYSSQHPISLQYDDELEYIVFDHLEPIDGVSKDNFSLYATNLSYDVFKKTDFGWQLQENIYLNNAK